MGLPRDNRSKTLSKRASVDEAKTEQERELKAIMQICKSLQKLTKEMCKVMFEVMVERDSAHDVAAANTGSEALKESSANGEPNRGTESSVQEAGGSAQSQQNAVKTPQHTEEESQQGVGEKSERESQSNSSFPSVKKPSSESSVDEVPAKRIKMRHAKTSSEDFSEENLAEASPTSTTTVVVSSDTESD